MYHHLCWELPASAIMVGIYQYEAKLCCRGMIEMVFKRRKFTR